MREDRVFFAPGALAIGKGFVCLLAFCTALVFVDATIHAYYFGIIIYCCGFWCDYIEISMKRSGKCSFIRRLSFSIAIVIGIIIILTFSLLANFDSQIGQVQVAYISYHKFFINLFFCIFWVFPLGSGILLCYPRKDKQCEPEVSGLGYQAFCQMK